MVAYVNLPWFEVNKWLMSVLELEWFVDGYMRSQGVWENLKKKKKKKRKKKKKKNIYIFGDDIGGPVGGRAVHGSDWVSFLINMINQVYFGPNQFGLSEILL